MPRCPPSDFVDLGLDVDQFVAGFDLHDVWRVELEPHGSLTVPGLRALLTPERARGVNPVVRGLFAFRSALGRLFRWDPQDAWTTRHEQDDHGVYHVVNATVNAILVVALVPSNAGRRLFWATYLKPVGRITAFYMSLIDPFRRVIVYPGLESWMKRTLAAEARGNVA